MPTIPPVSTLDRNCRILMVGLDRADGADSRNRLVQYCQRRVSAAVAWTMGSEDQYILESEDESSIAERSNSMT